MSIHALTGRSGLGKSAFLIRPLRWLFFNRPVGEGYRRWGSDVTRVDGYFDDTTGHLVRLVVENFQCHHHVDVAFGVPSKGYTRVSRVRSGKTNHYEMARGTGKAEIYKIAGDKKVPETIANYLNVGAINFSGQHDPPYLLGLSPPDLAKHLNAMAGLGDMDAVMARAVGEVNRAKKAKESAEIDVGRWEGEVGKYSTLPDMEIEVEVLGILDGALGEAATVCNKLRTIVDTIRAAQENITRYSPVLECKAAWREVEGGYQKYQHVIAVKGALSTTLDTAKKAQGKITRLASVKGRGGEIVGIESKMGVVHGIAATLRKLHFAVETAKDQLRDLHTQREELARAKNLFTTLAPDVCPLCGGDWGEENKS